MSDRLPTLNGLRAFESAARHLSFTKAAAELNVTQTAVSHLIGRLEEQLGIMLFRRQNRTLTLTPEGQDYLPAVRGAFDQLRRATGRLRRRDSQVLTITTLASLAAKWLVPRLGDFRSAYPDIDVRVTTTGEVIDLARSDIDMAVRYGLGHWPGLRAQFLMAEDVFPVCSPKLLTGEKALKTPEDLARFTLLHEPGFREDWRTWLTAAGLPNLVPAGSITLDLTAAVVQAAIEGLGVALGRSTFVDADISAGRLVAPFAMTLPAAAGYYIVTAPHNAGQPKIKAFSDWLLGMASKRRVDRPQAAPYEVTDE
jgi:LysR family transcriptional regulator, glycine cleavage system transcriptional activator